jgi:hypothetical protein
MTLLKMKDEAAKFAQLANDLERLVDFATKAKEKAEEMEGSLKTYAGMLDDAGNIDTTDASEVEWSKKLEANIASAESQLVDPLKGGGDFKKPSLAVLLSIVKDYSDCSGFKSELLDKAEAQEKV